MYSNRRAVAGMSRMFMCTRQILNRKVKNNIITHARDECIVNISAASKM